ncbi:TlpA family protein disulfide reductase [Streptomyces sp. NPDC059164]|uniref:TlpA family protein disulfide reductase n=1 Tax=unclassified Streptomyces TaxID=2593676 RepID=UPI00093251E0|nr:TlpA disulfide reductase family protein [Streptomyces sp. NBRC 110465]
MTSRSVSRAATLTAFVTMSALTLAGCGNGGGSGGGGQTNYVTSTDGISRIPKDERESVGTIKGKSIQGDPMDVADLRGKVVVINAWGSWCPPCRAEAPHFNKVAKETKDKGVAFFGINARDRDITLSKAFEEDYKMVYPSLYDPIGKSLLTGFPKGTLNPQALPTTIVLDRDGKIAARSLSGMNEEALRALIAPVLKEA